MSVRALCWFAACGLLIACEKRESVASQPETPAATVAATDPDPKGLLEVGDRAPDVTLATHTGQAIELSKLRGSPVVIYFYPKDMTPGCTLQAQELRDNWKAIKATGAHVFGVSTDDNVSHRAFASAEQLPFLLVSDTEQKLAGAFGVPVKNGKAKRVTFVIGKDGVITNVFDGVTPKGSAGEVLEALAES